jgi:hypothetical protein
MYYNLKAAGDDFVSLSMICHANDTPNIGSGIKNCTTKELYEGITYENLEDIEDLKNVASHRPYLVLVDGNGGSKKIAIIKNNIENSQDAKQLQIYDESTELFIPLDQQKLSAFGLRPDTKMVLFNKIIYDDSIEHFQALPTLTSIRNTTFYHEKQKGGECGIHAANAFFGDRIITPTALSHFNKMYYGAIANSQVTQFAAEYKDDYPASMGDASEGNNPTTLHQFILNLASAGKINAAYQNAELDLFETPKSGESISEIANYTKDRCIIGTRNPDHFVAFRKDQNDQWFLINSESPDQIPCSPSEYLKTQEEGKQVFFIHL